jgi:hypothetical protein
MNRFSCLAILLLLAAGCGEHAPTVRERLEQGNQAFARKDFAAAAKAYEQASVDAPDSPYVAFDAGAVAYRNEDYPKAREDFETAMRKAPDGTFEAKCHFNIGNCSFREAERQRDSSLKDSIEAYRSSIKSYQEARRLDPTMKEAAQNLELARLRLKMLLDELHKQQEKQKQQQQQQQKLADKLKELAERQQAAADQNQQLQKNPSATPQEKRQLADEQKKLQQETADLAKQMGQPQPQQPNQPQKPQPQQDVQQALQHQQSANDKLDQQNLPSAKPEQDKAAESLRKALERMTKEGDKQEQKGGENQQQGDQQEQGQKKQGDQQQDGQKKEQQQQQDSGDQQQQQKAKAVRQAAKDILDKEKQNRKRRQVGQVQGLPPVDKDW